MSALIINTKISVQMNTLTSVIDVLLELQSLLFHCYWRLGREVGLICKVFKEAGLSWGTYVDMLGTHCNSHINNLVLIPPDQKVPL